MSALPEPWHEWLPRAHRIIQRWEAEYRLLSTLDAVRLSEEIAHGLAAAYEEGRGAGSQDSNS